MGYTTVDFLGEKYQVSDSINDFIYYDIFFSKITRKLMSVEMESIKSYSKFKPSTFCDLAEKDSNKYHRLTDGIADDLVKELLNKGIYDVTKRDLLKDTTIFSLDEEYMGEYDKFVLQTKLECGIKYIDYIESQQIDIANAYMNAASNITGSGVTVFSSSFATLMAHSLVENSILSSQAKRADREYQAAVRDITSRVDNAYEQYCKDTMLNKFFPQLTNMLTNFVDTVMAEFLPS